VTATDCAGNQSEPRFTPNLPRALQDDNTSTTALSGSISYAGRWKVSHCACWSAATTHKTWAAGARATYTSNFERGERLALVMAKGPDRGKAKIFVDGHYRTTINTYAPTRQHRIVVWQSWMPAGEHTVEIVNKATPGHPRIDLDAVVVSRFGTFDWRSRLP
jgi:hypothetical protein